MPDERVSIETVDFTDPAAVDDYLHLLDAYARDPMGGGIALSDSVRARLPLDLAANSAAYALLARRAARAVGVATCFVGYSTFRALPLMNIHDIAVVKDARGQGIGEALMGAIVGLAGRLGCCKVTLEVRADNATARRLYEREGFAPSSCSLFMEKALG